MDSLVLCKIPDDFNVALYFEDKYFEEIEPEDVDYMKNLIIEASRRLKEDGFYSGEELEYSVFMLYEILEDLKFVVKKYSKTGYGIDILNIRKVVEEVKSL